MAHPIDTRLAQVSSSVFSGTLRCRMDRSIESGYLSSSTQCQGVDPTTGPKTKVLVGDESGGGQLEKKLSIAGRISIQKACGNTITQVLETLNSHLSHNALPKPCAWSGCRTGTQPTCCSRMPTSRRDWLPIVKMLCRCALVVMLSHCHDVLLR